ncbi:alpha/beta fold hydrolase [Streptomyces sp. NPDC055140]
MATFVLVPGGWKGSWSYEAVIPLLERAGHAVHALTLPGLRPDDDKATVATANLDTHADDVLRHLDRNHITSATLVGHSYAGMVIAAAADRADGRISRLVHLDAFVPRNGESWWSSTNEYFREVAAAGAAATGYAIRPPDGGDPRRRPHPLASFLQTIRLTDTLAQVPRREFIYCSGWEDRSPFAVRRTPHPPPSRSRVAGPRPPNRPRRHARGTGGGRRTAARRMNRGCIDRVCHGDGKR